MTDVIKHEDGDVCVTDLPNGRRRLELLPRNSKVFISRKVCETSYSNELIASFLRLSGFSWLCDWIARDQDPTYLERSLRVSIFSFVPESSFRARRLLDFGCGAGASSVVSGRMLPETEIVGVELDTQLLELAEAIAHHHGLSNVRFLPSPSSTELPPSVGVFDFVVLSAVYEHLLPNERRQLMPLIWGVLSAGGTLFLNQTPHRYFPIEMHSTGLPFINYLPDRLAHWVAVRFGSKSSINQSPDWNEHLRGGIRGATEREILHNISTSSGPLPLLLEPCLPELRDRVDLWLSELNPQRYRPAKLLLKVILKPIYYSLGTVFVPNLSIAIRKGTQLESNRLNVL